MVIGVVIFATLSLNASLHEIINTFVSQYNRPITIIYISDHPAEIPTREKDVLVVWGPHNYRQILTQSGSLNCILLTLPCNTQSLISLAECEHFDVAIIDKPLNTSLLQSSAHLADYTIILPKNCNKETLTNEDIILRQKQKKILRKNWWKNQSHNHSNYPIVSTFDEKYFIKSEKHMETPICRRNKLAKKHYWKPGINLLTYINMQGNYPSKKFVREKVIEVFNPVTHKDFGAGNVIMQGLTLTAIDYDDSIYAEDPYARLERTLRLQLGLPYK